MKEKFSLSLQLAAVFIGTIVGAGLASGQEITQFFTTYGYKSFFGLPLCCLIYIFIGYLIIKISIRYNLNSYNSLIKLISPGFLGEITDLLTGLFLICSAAIILAGSGSLLHQYFGIAKWIGWVPMCIFSIIILLRNTKGLLEINSFIVPSLIIVITTIFIMFICFGKNNISVNEIKSIPYFKSNWLISTLLYSGFNILCCSGVLVPLSTEIRKKNVLVAGTIMGSIALTIICTFINLMLLYNIPYIFKYDIPLLYIANRFGKLIQILLLSIIWLEMFSTEVSDIYSIAKTLQQKFSMSYNRSIIIILFIAIPVSQFGFVNLIRYLYPAFGIIGILFMIQCIIFDYRNFHRKNI